MGLVLPVYSLARRELVRFLRQRNRVVGAFLTPVIFWLLFGFGLSGSFRPEGDAGAGYMEFFFPGVLVMILLFTAIFSTISIIEDRKEGFLQSVLVAPVSRSAIVLGKVFGGTALAVGQAAVFLVLAPTVGIQLNPLNVLAILGAMLPVAFALTALGFALAWVMDSTQGYHAIMNVFLFPMWLLSGAFFPAKGAPVVLEWVIKLNPLTYGVALTRHALYLDPETLREKGVPSVACALGATLLFAAVTFAWAYRAAAKRTKGDLQ